MRKGKGKVRAPTTQSGTATVENTPILTQPKEHPNIIRIEEGEAINLKTHAGPLKSDVGDNSKFELEH